MIVMPDNIGAETLNVLRFEDHAKYELKVTSTDRKSKFYLVGLRGDRKKAVQVATELRDIEERHPVRFDFMAFLDANIAQALMLDGFTKEDRDQIEKRMAGVSINWTA